MLVDFHSVYERYVQDIFRFALYLSGDASLADDITQETFVRAWVTPGEVRGGTVRAYLTTIARNLYRAEHKREARQVALSEAILASRPGPEVVTSARLELADVLQALQQLPEIDRAALLMHAQEGLSHAEIAATLGLSVAAVKVKIHRARIKLNRITNPKKG